MLIYFIKKSDVFVLNKKVCSNAVLYKMIIRIIARFYTRGFYFRIYGKERYNTQRLTVAFPF